MPNQAVFKKIEILARAKRQLDSAYQNILRANELDNEVEVTLVEVLAELQEQLTRTEPKAAFLTRGPILRKKDNKEMSFQLQDDQKVAYTIGETDDAGNATPFQGTATWSVSDPTILNIDSISDDGSSATVSSTGTLGTAQVAVALEIPGVADPIGLSDDVTVVVSPPTGATLVAGTAEHK